MTKNEALKMAIEAMEFKGVRDSEEYWQMMNATKNACKEALEQPLTRDWKHTIDERIARDSEFKEALEQPAQEPVAYIKDVGGYGIIDFAFIDEVGAYPVYTHPHQWQGLTDDEIDAIIKEKDGVFGAVVRAIEQELKTKNGFSGLKEKNYGAG